MPPLVLCSVLSLRALFPSYDFQGRAIIQVHRMTEPHSRISVLPQAQVTSTERHKEIHILISISVEYLLDTISAYVQSS